MEHVNNKELEEKPKDMIETLIEMRRQYNEILEKSCNKDNKLSLSIRRAFEDFINKSQTISILLAKYIDGFFK
jgi:hypothetical protein